MRFFDLQVTDALSGLKKLAPESVDCVMTSPPYYSLRSYGGQVGMLGQEKTVEEYLTNLVDIFKEVRTALKPAATIFLNLGDTYINKQLAGIPWAVAFAMKGVIGLKLQSEIIWHKRRIMPDGQKKRPTRDHEQIFFFSKTDDYFWDAEAIGEPLSQVSIDRYKYKFYDEQAEDKHVKRNIGMKAPPKFRNRRTVWDLPPPNFRGGGHPAMFPEELPELCIKAGCPKGGLVLDPFAGVCTTALAALKNGRRFVGMEISPEYAKIGKRRILKEI